MAIKLKRIHIQNFKAFEDYLVEFNSSNLVVFDGPNGFGKTSFYDAIELLFTGGLRRYADLVEKVVDKRHTSTGSPLLNDRGIGDLVIKGELGVDGKAVCLVRRGSRVELERETQLNKPEFPLYETTQFNSEEFTLVEDEHGYLTSLLGKDYIRNFEYLNYIEQEENIYFLKNKDKDRKDAIAHLFNTSEFDDRVGQLTDASRKVGKLCGQEAKGSLRGQKEYLDEYRSRLTGEYTSLPFIRLSTWKKIGWDAEKLEFPDEQYVDWLGKGGELDELEYFLVNIDEFRRDLENKMLDKLLGDEGLVTQFLLCWNYIDSAEDFKKSLTLKMSIDDLFQGYGYGVLDALKARKLELTPQIQELVKSVIDVHDYSDLIADILDVHKNANTLSQLLIDVKESRRAFIDKYMKYEAEVGPDKSCPLCGYSWRGADELKANYKSQAAQIEQLIKASGSELNHKLDKLEKNYLAPIKKQLEDYQSKYPVDVLFVNKLVEAVDNHAVLDELSKQFLALDIDIKPFLNDKPFAEEEINLEKLRAIVNEKRHTLNPEKIRPYYGALFLQVFDESYEHVSSIDKSALALKRKYIEWQYSLHQNDVVKDLEKKYSKQEKQLADARLLKKKIDNLKKIYVSSLKTYQKDIIENIEILFHIYSGRIAQEGKGSLGLFIGSDKNGIRFLEKHSKQHDAIFTMSSGQLATLVIAFTLALNKRYSKNKILFVDDPIQTLDELNIAGLVELLRNEFADRQIFISTHEDMMSAYMRYKFKKYGLGAQRLNFKESQLSLN